ncbi:short chain dehydrogenase [Bacteroidota bacterium]|nr:short chain dehydrogenase [Bacteroidota bacterium]
MNDLKNKVVIITGASSGIGKACAMEFVKAGCKVVITGRNALALADAAMEINNIQNAEVLQVVSDVSIENDCKKIIAETINRFGKIDVLINNAGVSMRALFNDLDLSVIKQLMDTNFWGTVYCTKYALPEILKQKGSVVGISSVAGYLGLPGRTGYSASKFAIHGFLGALRSENLKTGLHVLICCPGYTESNIRKTALNQSGKAQGDTPLDEKKLMSAEDVAVHIVNGVKYRKRTIILTAQGKISVLLGKFFPAWLDKMAYNTIAKEADSPFK